MKVSARVVMAQPVDRGSQARRDAREFWPTHAHR